MKKGADLLAIDSVPQKRSEEPQVEHSDSNLVELQLISGRLLDDNDVKEVSRRPVCLGKPQVLGHPKVLIFLKAERSLLRPRPCRDANHFNMSERSSVFSEPDIPSLTPWRKI